ncbi:hypothetical protein RUND412_000365 [Rhizina undulata]
MSASPKISPLSPVNGTSDISGEPLFSFCQAGPSSKQTASSQTPPTDSPPHKQPPSPSPSESPRLILNHTTVTSIDKNDRQEIKTDMDNMPSKPSLPPSNLSSAGAFETENQQNSGRPATKTAVVGKKRPAPESEDTEEGDFGNEKGEKIPGSPPTKTASTAKGGRRGRVKKAKTKAVSKSQLPDNEPELGDVGEKNETPQKRKPPTATANKKGNWSKEEDDLILAMKREEKGWQEITTAVTKLSGADRSLTAVRLRYQKVLKGRDIELSNEEAQALLQAEKDVATTEKYRFIAARYKELTGDSSKELTKSMCQQLLSNVLKKHGSGWTPVNTKAGE